MSFNVRPNTTHIEIGEKSGVTPVNAQVIIGSENITTFEGCLDDGKLNICPSDADKSMYNGDSYSDIQGVGDPSLGCSATTNWPHEPGMQKCLDVKMSVNPFTPIPGGSSTLVYFHSEEVDTNVVYDWNSGWKNVEFTNNCGGSTQNTSSLYNLSTNKFKNTVGAGLKVKPDADVYFNGVTAGPNNTNSLSVRLRIKHTKASGSSPSYYFKPNTTTGQAYTGSANFNDKCDSNSYVNTQNLGGFGLSNTFITLALNDTLEFQIRIGRNDPGLDDTDDATKLCDGGFPSPPGLGLTQDPNNCATGMGTRIKWTVDYSNIVTVTGIIPSFCNDPATNQPGTSMYKTSNYADIMIPNNSVLDYPCNVAGRSLYFVHNNPSYLSDPDLKKQEFIIADIVDSSDYANQDRLLLKGNGGEQLNALSTLVPQWYSQGGVDKNYNWYISCYQHSGNWDSSGVGFRWENIGHRNSTVISYEDEEGAGLEHSIYNSNGELGYRSCDIFDEGLDCWELEVTVAGINNTKIQIHEGTASNPALTPTNPVDITSPGTYKYCLAALQATGMWSDCAAWSDTAGSNSSCGSDGSVDSTVNNRFSYFNAGGIKILTAISSGSNSSCNISDIKITKKTPEITTVNKPIYGGNYTYDIDEYTWHRLDVLESSQVPLSITFSIGDLKDITKRGAGFSKTFSLPASAENEKILGSMLAVGSERQMISWEKARIRTNGIIIFSGLIRIEKGTTGKGGSYKCHMIEDTIDWSQALGDKELCDVSIIQNNPVEKTRQSVMDSWTLNKPYNFDKGGAMGSGQTLAEDYFWGVANYGEWHRKFLGGGNTFAHDTFDFHPVVYAKRVVEKIFLQSGYTLDSRFWESQTAALLCHPFSSGEDYYTTDPNSLVGQFSQNLADAAHPGGACGGNYQSGGKIPGGGYDRTWYPLLNVASDFNNNMTGTSPNTCGGASNKGYVVPFDGDYDITLKGNLNTRQSSWGSGAGVFFEVLKNGSSLFGWSMSTYGSWTSLVQNGVKTLNAGDVISFRVRGQNYSSVYSCWQDVKNIKFLVYPAASTTPPPQFVNFNKIFECGTKQIDYLKGFTDMFNLQWTSNEDSKIVYCEPYDDFFGSGKVLDWTDKLDHESWTDKFIIEELAKTVTFRYAEDTSDEGYESTRAWLEKHNKPIYQAHVQNNEEKFRKEALELGTDIFSSTVSFNNYGTQASPTTLLNGNIGWGDMTWTSGGGTVANNPIMPYLWTEEGGRVNYGYPDRPPYVAYPKIDLRVLNHYSLLNGRLVNNQGDMTSPSITGCRTWNFYEGGSLSVNHFPYMDWLDKYKKGVSVDPYNLSWSNYDDELGNVSQGLYFKYWHTAYQKMNGGAALRTCKMHLTPNDIAMFDYRDLIKIVIDNVATYWTVQKIKDYKPNQEVLTTVELVEYKTKVDFGNVGEDDNYTGQSTQSEVPQSRYENTPQSISTQINKNKGNTLGEGIIASGNQVVVGKYNIQNKDDVFSVGTGSNDLDRVTALSIDSCGEVTIAGGELIVEETTGVVHDLVFTETKTLQDGTIETSLKKVYLKK